MDNNPVGFTNLYDPLATTGYVFDPSTNQYVPADQSLGTGATNGGTPGPTIGPPTPGTDPGSLVSSLIDQIPGASSIEALLNAVKSLPIAIENMLNTVEAQHPWAVFTQMIPFYADGLAKLIPTDKNLWQFFEHNLIGGLFESMLSDGLGVDTSLFDADALKGVETTDKMLSFVFALQYGIAAVDHIGKGVFANRWPETLSETIAKIPEEMGLSWALGLVIDESFKTAVGRSLEEGINRQKRGNRIEWPQIRIALKQHILEQFMLGPKNEIIPNPSGASEADGKAVYAHLLKNQGFPDWTIDVLDKLADAQLPVGDLQQMYLRGIMTDKEVKAYLTQLGFNAKDSERLYTQYIEKAETEASATLRSTARALYTNNLITKKQYTDILDQVDYPDMLKADDLQAIQLLHDTGRVNSTVASIKSYYLHNHDTPQVTIDKLKQLNYTDQAIHDLMAQWDATPILRDRHISQAKVLSYFISGLMHEPEVRTRLLTMGIDPKDVDFLILHPTAAGGVRQHALTIGMIMQAYAEGLVLQKDLASLFKQIGVTDAALPHYLDQAYWKRSHFKQSPDHVNTLTDADIRAAFKAGLMEQRTATSLLQANGWSADDALLLLEITNKGPITSPTPNAFATPQQAVEFLLYYGWTVQQPPDPIFMEAEVRAQTAGYIVQPPPGWDPNNPSVPGGGPPPPLPIPIPTPTPLPQPRPIPQPLPGPTG